MLEKLKAFFETPSFGLILFSLVVVIFGDSVDRMDFRMGTIQGCNEW